MNMAILKIGIGGISGDEVITFDFCDGDKLRPYVCEIKGRDFKYVFKREFTEKKYTKIKRKFYDDKVMELISFNLKKYVVYEYKRFPGLTMGEIEEGYFVILSDCIKELEFEEVLYWVGTAREKEKRQAQQRMIFGPQEKYAPDDIDF